MEAWRAEIRVRADRPDPVGAAAAEMLEETGLRCRGRVRAVRGYLLGAGLTRAQVETFAREVLSDPIVDTVAVLAPDEAPPAGVRVSVVPRPGVTDPAAHSVQKALVDAGLKKVDTGTYRGFEVLGDIPVDDLRSATTQRLANEVVQEVVVGAPPGRLPGPGQAPDLTVHAVPIRDLPPDELLAISRQGGLALDAAEMAAIQQHFAQAGREPTRLELETLAQTWSEHCKHKTLTGRVRYRAGPDADPQEIDNLLRTTIAHVTTTLARDFCVSVFVDNAGVVAFDDDDCVCIKVETHNHPSAIEPFGGAGTGVGGVIRDVLGTGLGAKPIASSDVFCLAPLDTDPAAVPTGCLHPRQTLRGLVAGVRDYGNPMGIPTVHGAVHFDPDFIGNPLVYVGNVGLLPRDMVQKRPRAGDVVLAIGGRTGRDGIHGATFSSLELHTESESLSGGAVQIGDPITERKVMDAVLRMRDERLFGAITDCGAGGFSSAVGEMAEGLGADVELADVPLKYQGLAPWEIWVSEAQERMVLAVPPEHLPRALAVCDEEDVEATAIGRFVDSGRLVVRYGGTLHGDLDLQFLHHGVPRRTRDAVYERPALHDPDLAPEDDLAGALLRALADPNVASKEWIVRQYDHEVQAASAGKPLVGARNDGPADAAVLAPKLSSRRGIVLSSGLNPRYARIDPAAMAECALDEALRNVVAAGGDPDRTAVLDNYCWGNTELPDRLGGLVRASLALRDLALAYRTPFVSGKDSLNNEFRADDRLIPIPGCILVTALSVIDDVTRTTTSDLKQAGNELWIVGLTRAELGGSVYWKQHDLLGASVPRVDAELGRSVLVGVWRAIQAGCVVAAHDCSEGGLGVAVAEMALGGRLGARLDLAAVPVDGIDPAHRPEAVLFSESQSRLVLEVSPERRDRLLESLGAVPCARIGEVTAASELVLARGGADLATVTLAAIEQAWKSLLGAAAPQQEGEP